VKSQLDFDKIKKEIIARLSLLEPEKVILFGSYANGTATEDSDIDLYIVTKDDFIPQSFRENMKLKLKISKAIDFLRDYSAVDTIVHTKPMADLFQKQNSSLYKEIALNGLKLL
jgi:uncharacterized protein